jgi:predicted metal-dependent phosphoesterase TrpH
VVSVRVIVVPAVFLLAGVILDDGALRASRSTIERHFSPADRLSGRYQYVPFDVPPGTGRLHVAYRFDRANGDNVIDLGLFEPGLLDLGTSAFRGYSGGARTEFTIDADAATPGYAAGPLPPGQWHVLLGLYKIAPSGVDVAIDIATTPASPLPVTTDRTARAPREAQPSATAAVDRAADAPGWYMGALHTHTLHSDGSIAPAALLQKTRDLGFDFVAITDHNNTTHRRDLAGRSPLSRPLWIAGEEVTTANGHASVWGLDEGEWVDFRVRAEDRRIGEVIASAHRFGALFSINHPVSECVGCGWEHEIPTDVDAIEVSNGRHGEVAAALAIWDKLLAAGRRITGVGSSDWHRAPDPIDVANTRVYATSLTENAIVAAIRSGRAIVVNGAQHATPEVSVQSAGKTAGIGDSLTLGSSASITLDIKAPTLANGRLVVVANGERSPPVALDGSGTARVERRAAPGYVRVELSSAADELVAITNPVYLVRP